MTSRAAVWYYNPRGLSLPSPGNKTVASVFEKSLSREDQYQIKPDAYRINYVRAKVEVRVSLDRL